MAIEDDVLVIGGGLAGTTAALAAAETGAQVRLVSHKQSTLRHASGLIDILGYTPDGDGPLVDPYDAIAELPEGHPYERVGVDAVRDALSFFDEIAGDMYEGNHTDSNALVPTHGGTVKPTARYPKSSASGLASDPQDTLLVGFDTMSDFDAPLAAAHLEAAGAPFEARGVTVTFPGIKRDDAKITRYAHMLDRDETVEMGVSETGVRNGLVETVKPHLDGETRVGFPAVLGDDHPDEVRAALADGLGVEVFEIPMGPPSLPGMRLEDMLYNALEDAGVRTSSGVPVVDFETNGSADHIDHVVVDRHGAKLPHSADQYILATGGLVGKGVKSERESVFEPIFDCHVAHAEDRYDWFVDDVFGDQPYAQFGLAANHELRPLDADDETEFENLRAVGAVLGGYDFAAEKSGAGVSLATGYAAGQQAGAEGGD